MRRLSIAEPFGGAKKSVAVLALPHTVWRVESTASRRPDAPVLSREESGSPSDRPISPSNGSGGAHPDQAVLRSAIERSRDYLWSRQDSQGFWCGELEADSMLEADYIYLHALLESGDPMRLKRALTEIFLRQNPDGSWSLYPGGPGNISLGVKCYFAAKLMGVGADDPRMVRSRKWILENGAWWRATRSPRCISARSASTTTTRCPRFRRRSSSFRSGFYFNLYEISSWSRSILVPLAIITRRSRFGSCGPNRASTSCSSAAVPAPSSGCRSTGSGFSPGGISSWSSTGSSMRSRRSACGR